MKNRHFLILIFFKISFDNNWQKDQEGKNSNSNNNSQEEEECIFSDSGLSWHITNIINKKFRNRNLDQSIWNNGLIDFRMFQNSAKNPVSQKTLWPGVSDHVWHWKFFEHWSEIEDKINEFRMLKSSVYNNKYFIICIFIFSLYKPSLSMCFN